MFQATPRRISRTLLAAGAAALALALVGTAACAQRPGPQGGGLVPPDTLVVGDLTGFVSIFDGTLKGWDGDPRFWRAENDEIIGESTAQNPVTLNNFLIWRGGTPRDFELKLEFRISGTNSGVQFRSRERPELGKWVMSGYQADIDFQGMYVGNIHEERGRMFLAQRGTMTAAEPGKRPRVIGKLAESTDLKGLYRINGWNQYHIIAQGNTLTLILNGHVTGVFVDRDPENRALEGLLGFQMHVGPPFRVEYRNIYLKTL